MKLNQSIFFAFCFLANLLSSQNQQSKWYFGNFAALDFMQNPPTPLQNNAMFSGNSASVADENGNLLFYTNGVNVWNKSHLIMANGNGLLGNFGTGYTCLIIQKPGSASLYYIFTVQGNGGPAGFNYSIVDMSLAAGQGSVTVKNAAIYSASCVESISGTRHCNGKDYWVIIHERFSNNFRTYLLNAAGISSVAVVSSIGHVVSIFTYFMKVSPQGNVLAAITQTYSATNLSAMNTYEFDNTTGVLSNHLFLPVLSYYFGLEFSPNGRMLYCGSNSTCGGDCHIVQWDLCAGSHSAIAASQTTLAAPGGMSNMELAINGKIYVAIVASASLGVINSPNASGAACNFDYNGQTLGGKTSLDGLPLFVKQYKVLLPPFNHSLNVLQGCHAMSFTANLPASECASTNFSVTSILWDFGDPSTGLLNNSSALNPTHFYSSSGTYTASLIFNYKCGADTIKQIIQIPPPNVVVTFTPNCIGTASAAVNVSGGVGPYTYSWSPSSQSSSLVTLSAGVHSITINDLGLACKVNSVITVTVNPVATFSISPSNTIAICSGSSNIVQAVGNCTNYAVFPSTGANLNGFNITFNPNSSQNYTVTGTLGSCTVSTICAVNVLALPSPSIVTEKSKACLNSVIKLEGLGGKSYFWEGPAGFSSTTQNISRLIINRDELGIYKLEVTDSNGCKNINTVLINLSATPSGMLTGFKNQNCVPFCYNFQFKPSNDTSNVISNWQVNGQTFNDKFSYCFTAPGIYTLSGVLMDTTSSCTSNLSHTIQAHAKPEAEMRYHPQNITDNQEDVVFTNNSTGADLTTCSWFFNDKYKSKFESNSVTYKFEDAGLYTIAMIVTNKWNCADTAVKTIQVEADFGMYVPNAFTPNNDGLNDEFKPVIRSASKYNLKIFDRWGHLIFESNDIEKGWDGTNRGGVNSKGGVYAWRIEVTSLQGESKSLSGHVTLLR